MDYVLASALLASEIKRKKAKSVEKAPINSIQSAVRLWTMVKHNSRRSGIICWNFGRGGHFQSDCRAKIQKYRAPRKARSFQHRSQHQTRRHSQQRPSEILRKWRWETPFSTSRKDNTNPPTVFYCSLQTLHMSFTLSVKSDDAWLNCGANDHFIWNWVYFEKYRSMNLIFVETSDGKAKVVGVGTVHFMLWTVWFHCHASMYVASEKRHFLLKILSSLSLWVFFLTGRKGLYNTNERFKKTLHTECLKVGLYPFPCALSKHAYNEPIITLNDVSRKWHSILGHISTERQILASRALRGIPEFTKKDSQTIRASHVFSPTRSTLNCRYLAIKKQMILYSSLTLIYRGKSVKIDNRTFVVCSASR